MGKDTEVNTPHGIAKIIRIEDVYCSHDDRITVEFPDGKISQYSSASLWRLPKPTNMNEELAKIISNNAFEESAQEVIYEEVLGVLQAKDLEHKKVLEKFIQDIEKRKWPGEEYDAAVINIKLTDIQNLIQEKI